MTPLLLALIGVALAWPVPAALAGMRWPLRAPRAGIVMWQSLALAAVLATFGAGLSTALWLVSPAQPGPWRIAMHVAVLALTLLVAGRLAWSTTKVWRDTHARRRRHRALADLLGRPDGAVPALRVIADQTPVAYCVPGLGSSRVVLSSGALEALDEQALAAVLEHERNHLRRRHDLVLEGFEVLRTAFPRVLRTDAPLHQGRVMVELLADDAARRAAGDAALARALVALSGSSAPAGTLGVGGAAAARMERLRDPHPRAPLEAAAALTLSVAVLVLPTVLLAVPWITRAWAQVGLG